MEKSFLPKLAFDSIKNAEIYYREEGSFSNEILETLHSYFGESLAQATELLEKCKIIQYSTPDKFRKVYKISTSQEQHTIFDEINFCQCNFFKSKVLDGRNSLTCKHVLAVCLGKIRGDEKKEVINERMYEDFLNEQLNYCLDIDTQEIRLS